MKTALILLLNACLLATTSFAQTPDVPYALAIADEEIRGERYVVNLMSFAKQKLEVLVDKAVNDRLEIRLRNAEHQLLFDDRMRDPGGHYGRVLNLSALVAGCYWLDIRIGRQTVRRQICVETTTAPYRSLTLLPTSH